MDQLDARIARFLADGAYDGAPTSDLLKVRFGETVEIIIPPPKNAPKECHLQLAIRILPDTQGLTFKDRHIAEIQTLGRGFVAWAGNGWQSSSGYNQRSRVETHMGR